MLCLDTTAARTQRSSSSDAHASVLRCPTRSRLLVCQVRHRLHPCVSAALERPLTLFTGQPAFGCPHSNRLAAVGLTRSAVRRDKRAAFPAAGWSEVAATPTARFLVRHWSVPFGQHLRIVGGGSALGNWDPKGRRGAALVRGRRLAGRGAAAARHSHLQGPQRSDNLGSMLRQPSPHTLPCGTLLCF